MIAGKWQRFHSGHIKDKTIEFLKELGEQALDSVLEHFGLPTIDGVKKWVKDNFGDYADAASSAFQFATTKLCIKSIAVKAKVDVTYEVQTQIPHHHSWFFPQGTIWSAWTDRPETLDLTLGEKDDLHIMILTSDGIEEARNRMKDLTQLAIPQMRPDRLMLKVQQEVMQGLRSRYTVFWDTDHK